MSDEDDAESRLDADFSPPPRDPDAMQPRESTSPPPVHANPNPQPAPEATLNASRVRCLNCGYDLTGAVIGAACSECGMIIGGGTLANATGKPTSGNAVASLVLGICSIVLGCASYGLFALVCGPLAIWFASRARTDIVAGRVNDGSAELATAGRVMGWIAVALLLMSLMFVAGLMILASLT